MFKKGDKVYSILKGWGEVTEDEGLRILVEFGHNNLLYYRNNGKYRMDDINPELYHTEPQIIVPKRRVERTGWISVSNEASEGYIACSNIRNNEKDALHNIEGLNDYTTQQITYYTEE